VCVQNLQKYSMVKFFMRAKRHPNVCDVGSLWGQLGKERRIHAALLLA
jgi:hypothetical protein